MNQEHSNERRESEAEAIDQPTSSTTNDKDVNLDDEALQAEYRKAYLEQLRRMSCPGCGEDPTVPF
jgi:hypothetical protein